MLILSLDFAVLSILAYEMLLYSTAKMWLDRESGLLSHNLERYEPFDSG